MRQKIDDVLKQLIKGGQYTTQQDLVDAMREAGVVGQTIDSFTGIAPYSCGENRCG